MLGGAAAAAAGGLVRAGAAQAHGTQGTSYQDDYDKLATEDSTHSIPFYGQYQAGIATPPQITAEFLSFDVAAANRRELIDLLRTLTERAAFLTHGGTAPPPRPGRASEHRDLLGAAVLPDDLTVTVALGASLFDDRYGLAAHQPAQLKTMSAFTHDQLDPKLTQGDLLVQVCANHRDTVGNAMLDVLEQTRGGMRLRWRMQGFRFPPRPVGIPRDWMGFKDGIANPNTDDATQMNQVVWVQRGRPEPAWTAGGTYQVVRIIRMQMEEWDKVPVAQQERIFGRRKVSGAPLYATDPNASDELDPVYTNDPQGLLTPLRCHIRLANPQTPQTAATSSILRRSYQYERSPDEGAKPDLGHVFCCFQRKLGTYIAMQNRLEEEMLVPYIAPIGGGYFFAVPGVRDARDYYASGLLRGLKG
jgi:deferrochelatase/peroxidase EfeB